MHNNRHRSLEGLLLGVQESGSGKGVPENCQLVTKVAASHGRLMKAIAAWWQEETVGR